MFYKNVGKYQVALEMDEKVISLQTRIFGPEHPHTLLAMNNLAISYKNVGKYQAALELEEKSLSLLTKQLGEEHWETTMSNLTTYSQNAAKYQTGLEMKKQVLLLRTRLLGSEHPDTMLAMRNLAASYIAVGKIRPALKLLEEVLSLRITLLGPQNPDTLISMWDLFITYRCFNMHAQRLNILRTAVPAYEVSEIYGVDHPDTIKLPNNLHRLLNPITNGSDLSSRPRRDTFPRTYSDSLAYITLTCS